MNIDMIRMKNLWIFCLISFCGIAQNPITNSSDWEVSNLLPENELNFPNEITFGPDNFLWITERSGKKVVKVDPDNGTKITMLDLSSNVAQYSRQDGLLGMAVHPDLYNDLNTVNNFVYLAYTYDSAGLKLKIVRFDYNAQAGLLDPSSSFTVLEGIAASNDHNSGRLKIGPDLKLYYTIGDLGANRGSNTCNEVRSQYLPQSSDDYADYQGKVLRINLDGSIPSDNPELDGVKSHVYTYGHRNAQGLVFGSNGILYSSEHGDYVDDEINIIKKGKNYGWPLISGYSDDKLYSYCNWSSLENSCDVNDFDKFNCASGISPILESESGIHANFEPPIGTLNTTVSELIGTKWGEIPSIAPSSIDIYENNMIPEWKKSLLIPTLKRGTIFRVKLAADGTVLENQVYEEFHSSNDRYRDLAIDPNGLIIYAITDNTGGALGPSGISIVPLENPGTIVKLKYVGINPGITKWDGSSWDNGLPSASKSVVINQDYDFSLHGGIEAKDMTINSDLDLDFESLYTLTVHGDLKINGTLIIGDTESLVLTDDEATVQGEIIKKEHSVFRNNTYDFTYWSSPVYGVTIEDAFHDVNKDRIFFYDQSESTISDVSNDDGTYWNVWKQASGEMIQGKGYASEGPENTTGVHEISFSGIPNNGLIEVSLEGHFDDSDMNNDFNLIGNPYASAIDIDVFFSKNADILDPEISIEPTAYFWTHASSAESGQFSNSDYATYNLLGSTGVNGGPVPTNRVGSGQGFFVRALKNGKVSFNNSMRIGNHNDQFFKRPKKEELDKNRIWLSLRSSDALISQILIGFDPRASKNHDIGFDAIRLNNESLLSFYSVINDSKYIIQGLKEDNLNSEIELGYSSLKEELSFRIDIDQMHGALNGYEIYLKDNLLNQVHNLKSEEYQFYGKESGDFPERFTLLISNGTLGINDVVLENEIHILRQDDSTFFMGKHMISEFRIYTILGELLLQGKPNSHSFRVDRVTNDAPSILLYQLFYSSGEITNGKFVN